MQNLPYQTNAKLALASLVTTGLIAVVPESLAKDFRVQLPNVTESRATRELQYLAVKFR